MKTKKPKVSLNTFTGRRNFEVVGCWNALIPASVETPRLIGPTKRRIRLDAFTLTPPRRQTTIRLSPHTHSPPCSDRTPLLVNSPQSPPCAMDPRYQWPPQGYPNAQYAPAPPAQPNGYPANGYPQYLQQPMPQGYAQPQSQSQSQHHPGHPRVVIPHPSQQYPPMHDDPRVQPRTAQPQVVIPARHPHPMAQMQNPRIRQVQVPVPRTVQRTSGGGYVEQSRGQRAHTQTPNVKSAQRSQSHQENPPRPQQRDPNVPVSNQHRVPLQPQSTPKNRPQSQIHTPTSQQHRSPTLSQTSSQVRSHPQAAIKKSAPQAIQTPTRPQHAPQTKALPADLAVLLLSAADEYINAAHGMGSVAALSQRDTDLQHYYKLMSTGLGCMEAVLKRYSQIPRDEAKLRLRYASLLIEETENNVEIEEVFTKGVCTIEKEIENILIINRLPCAIETASTT